jgi:uncharacterized membrane protein
VNRRNRSDQIIRKDNPETQQQRSVKVSRSVSSLFSGPLPPPEVLAQYNEVLPQAAERIITMAEGQSAHRQHLEKSVVDSNIASEKRGQYLGFTIMMTALVGGFVLVGIGKNAYGIAAILTALGSGLATYIYGKHTQRRELAKKAQAFTPD